MALGLAGLAALCLRPSSILASHFCDVGVADDIVARQSAGFVFGHHVSFSLHASSTTCSVERDQGSKEQGQGVRVRHLHHGA